MMFGLVLFWWSIVLRRVGEVGCSDVQVWYRDVRRCGGEEI